MPARPWAKEWPVRAVWVAEWAVVWAALAVDAP